MELDLSDVDTLVRLMAVKRCSQHGQITAVELGHITDCTGPTAKVPCSCGARERILK